METRKADKKARKDTKAPDLNGLALGLGIIFLLCIGIDWGYVADQSTATDTCLTYDVAHQKAKQENQQSATAPTAAASESIAYKTFTLPESYFTFEYPSTWTFEKEESAPAEDGGETYYNFYADQNKKEKTISLHYPMQETAWDTCLKFDTAANYTLSQFATNDPGSFVSYLNCDHVANWPDAQDQNLGSNISWQKGTLSQDGTEDDKQDGTEARITWEAELENSPILEHIAHSVKIVK